ncbi:MAG: serine/threonine protein phosphatase, partial [Bacteroidales bacterium]|nr:serine/threonine protein phosphatase [Bacteroidales bacterium]
DYLKKFDTRHPSFGVASYWADEKPVYDEEALNDISKELQIDTVITHTAPSFCELILKDGLTEWAELDPDIPVDCAREREIMDQIVTHLKSAEHPVSHWYYGHFHQSWSSEIDDILFSMLDILEFKEIR